MLKGLLGIIAFFFFFVVLILMLTGGMIVKTIRRMKKAAEEAAEAQARQYRDETGRQSQQYSQRRTSHSGDTRYTSSTGNADQPNQYATASGETIIDNRHQQRSDRKIFDDADGEYVEYEEA